MYLKDQLTNQLLTTKKPSSYELVNYAIRLAKNMVQVEREPRIATPGIINSAYLILEEIINDQDVFEEPQPKVDMNSAYSESAEIEEKKPRRKLLKTLRTTKPAGDKEDDQETNSSLDAE